MNVNIITNLNLDILILIRDDGIISGNLIVHISFFLTKFFSRFSTKFYYLIFVINNEKRT